MPNSLAGSHHCVGAMMHSTDSFVLQLVKACQSHEHGLSEKDIRDEAAKYKRSSSIDVESHKVFDACMSAVAGDHFKIVEHQEYTEFLFYKTFHTAVTHIFEPQLSRSKNNWRIVFSKALTASASEVFGINVDGPAKQAYKRESRAKGAELQLDDVFRDEGVREAMDMFKTALRNALEEKDTVHRFCNFLDRYLATSLNVVRPNVLLVNEYQISQLLHSV